MSSPCSHCLGSDDSLHRVDYDLQVKIFQMSHAQIAMKDNIPSLQFQLSQLIDEVDSLSGMVMDLKLSKKSQETQDRH